MVLKTVIYDNIFKSAVKKMLKLKYSFYKCRPRRNDEFKFLSLSSNCFWDTRKNDKDINTYIQQRQKKA